MNIRRSYFFRVAASILTPADDIVHTISFCINTYLVVKEEGGNIVNLLIEIDIETHYFIYSYIQPAIRQIGYGARGITQVLFVMPIVSQYSLPW